MPSPFPGMNPYLEQEGLWPDFHERFCPLVAELLTGQVRPHYIVKINEQLYIHELPAESRHVMGRADVAVTHPPVDRGADPPRRYWRHRSRFDYQRSMSNACPSWKFVIVKARHRHRAA
jgi:hypothetical protein